MYISNKIKGWREGGSRRKQRGWVLFYEISWNRALNESSVDRIRLIGGIRCCS